MGWRWTWRYLVIEVKDWAVVYESENGQVWV